MHWADEIRGKAWMLADKLAAQLPLGRPHSVVASDLRYLVEGIASAVEFSCTGIADRNFAWQKVRTVALGGSPQALEDLPEELKKMTEGMISPAASRAMLTVLDNIGVYIRHAVCVPHAELEHDSLAAEFLAEARSGNRLKVQGLVNRAEDVASFAEDVLECVQREVGRLWQIGNLTPPEEHLVSSLVHEILLGLAKRLPPLPAMAPTVALVRCTGEEHSLGQSFLEFYLQAEGVRGRSLLAPSPPEQALARLRQMAPDAIAISCTTPSGLRAAIRIVESLRNSPEFIDTPTLLGGSMLAGIPQLATKLGADNGGGRGRATAAWLASRVPGTAVLKT
jgi:methanogenic corrinoid protein MtbC1